MEMKDESNQNNGAQPSQRIRPLAIAILDGIKSGQVDPATLSENKKTVCVDFMMQQGSLTALEMADILGMSRATLFRYKKKIREENALAQLVLDESVVAQDMIDMADLCAAKLVAQKKYKDAWTVKKECLEKLQSLGYAKKVEQKLNIKGSISLLEVLDIESELGSEESGFDANGGSRLEA